MYPATKYNEKKKEQKEMKKKMKKLGGWRRAGPMDGRPLVAFTRGRNWAPVLPIEKPPKNNSSSIKIYKTYQKFRGLPDPNFNNSVLPGAALTPH